MVGYVERIMFAFAADLTDVEIEIELREGRETEVGEATHFSL